MLSGISGEVCAATHRLARPYVTTATAAGRSYLILCNISGLRQRRTRGHSHSPLANAIGQSTRRRHDHQLTGAPARRLVSREMDPRTDRMTEEVHRWCLNAGLDQLERWSSTATQREKKALYKASFAVSCGTAFRSYTILDVGVMFVYAHVASMASPGTLVLTRFRRPAKATRCTLRRRRPYPHIALPDQWGIIRCGKCPKKNDRYPQRVT